MIISDTATVIWNSRNKKHYVDRGYVFTKMQDAVEVKVEDLTIGSQALILIRCDYCGEIFSRPWYSHVNISRKTFDKTDCCGKNECVQKKAAMCVKEKFGGYSEMNLASTEKRISTNFNRYGCTNQFGNETVKQKIIDTNLEKYGFPYTQQNHEVHSKTVATCRNRYGVDNYIELFKGKLVKENSPNWKGGVERSRAERATYEYRIWRNEVFSKDSYRCCKCGTKSGEIGRSVELNAHHIRNWRDNPDLRYDVANGITLCDVCHREFHSIYGKRNNTETQIKEFIFSDKKIC